MIIHTTSWTPNTQIIRWRQLRAKTLLTPITLLTLLSVKVSLSTLLKQLLRKKAIMPMTYMIWLYSFKGSGAKRGVTGSDQMDWVISLRLLWTLECLRCYQTIEYIYFQKKVDSESMNKKYKTLNIYSSTHLLQTNNAS